MDGLIWQFAPPEPTRWFEDFSVGESFALPPRTLGPLHFRAYAEASGEMHELHTDPAYCQLLGLPGRLAHGFLVAAQTTAGACEFVRMVEAALVGMVEQSSRFLRPAHEGDTLYPRLTVTLLAPNTSTGVVGLHSIIHNQRRELVMEGMQKWVLRRRPV
ncbi:MaoC family dehydratase [Rhodovastum atsumiense]|uniref:MaoC family dehydratase n=1 Tax=Rhodovastum atsumiense TaxID=504468 RepID=A0A5M6IPT3_9PROT|nr:MaoC family dehydratase [Rhodovastum atsumiense]KAA5609485.1 MaoC family dehydratase [Rhodovastum atsumiense]CAH2600819.1 MaoC family dehydratase [Rhodovastum atsumiense]